MGISRITCLGLVMSSFFQVFPQQQLAAQEYPPQNSYASTPAYGFWAELEPAAPITRNFQSPQKDSTHHKFKFRHKAISIIIGIPFGVIGGVLAARIFGEGLEPALDGAVVGVIVFPFMNYEVMAGKMGAELNTAWSLSSGMNVPITSLEKARESFGASFSVNRHYLFSKSFALRLEVGFHMRRFVMKRQNLLYVSLGGTRYFSTADINFAVGYLDVATTLAIRVLATKNSELSVIFGPSLAVPVHDGTSFHTLSSRILEQGEPANNDLAYISDEPAHPLPNPNLELGVELNKKHFVLSTRFKWNFAKAKQIFPLHEKFYLNSLSFGIGHAF